MSTFNKSFWEKSSIIYFILTFPQKTEARFIIASARQDDFISVKLCNEHNEIPGVTTKILETNHFLREMLFN